MRKGGRAARVAPVAQRGQHARPVTTEDTGGHAVDRPSTVASTKTKTMRVIASLFARRAQATQPGRLTRATAQRRNRSVAVDSGNRRKTRPRGRYSSASGPKSDTRTVQSRCSLRDAAHRIEFGSHGRPVRRQGKGPRKAAASGGRRPILGSRRKERATAQARVRLLRVPALPHEHARVEAARMSEASIAASSPSGWFAPTAGYPPEEVPSLGRLKHISTSERFARATSRAR